jgi:hypothetical protein
MPRKKATPIIDALPTDADETAKSDLSDLSASTSPTEVKGGRKTGIFLPLNEEGGIDIKRLRGEDWKLDAARRALGTAPGEKPAGLSINEDFVRGLYRGFEVTLQRIGTLFLKWPADLASLIAYSDEQKNKLVPPTKAVIEKFAPRWLINHQEIATLAVILSAETHEMITRALTIYVSAHPELLQPKVRPNGHSSAAGSENRHQETIGATETT